MTDREQLRAQLLEQLAECALPVEQREDKRPEAANTLLYRVQSGGQLVELRIPTQNQNDVMIACIKFLLEDA